MMPGVVYDTLNTNIFLIGLTKELVRLIVLGTEFVIFTKFFLLACELKSDVIFGQISGFNLRAVFISACGTIKHFLFFIDYGETLFAYSMTAIKIPGYFLLRIIQVITHGTLHF